MTGGALPVLFGEELGRFLDFLQAGIAETQAAAEDADLSEAAFQSGAEWALHHAMIAFQVILGARDDLPSWDAV